jgi:hypothetical protein
MEEAQSGAIVASSSRIGEVFADFMKIARHL